MSCFVLFNLVLGLVNVTVRDTKKVFHVMYRCIMRLFGNIMYTDTSECCQPYSFLLLDIFSAIAKFTCFTLFFASVPPLHPHKSCLLAIH